MVPDRETREERETMKLTNELMSKVEKAFAGKDMILTGQGLGRNELRALERRGIIESKLFKQKEKGTIIRGWRLAKTGLIEKKDLTADRI
jgi:hypothetical protein